MSTRQRLFVPIVLALVIGASAPAVADDPTVASDPAVETTPAVEPDVQPSPEAATEPAEEPTPDPEPTVEPSQEPESEPTTQATTAPEPEVRPTVGPKARKAAAAPSTVTTSTELTQALAACEAGDTVTLGNDITASGALAVPCDLTLDLAGHDLVAPGTDIAAGRHLTIDDSATGGSLTSSRSGYFEAGIKSTDARLTIDGGTITASGGYAGAGIGGGGDDGSNGGNGGVITINGGSVTATGGGMAGGIGGAGWGSGGTVAIHGGTVRANGGTNGAGIGSGYNRGFTSITIDGGTVTARAGSEAAAIGSGAYGHSGGAPITIGAGADVSVTADANTAVIGRGNGYGTGPVTVDGTLRVTSGDLQTNSASITVGAAGSILGPDADPDAGPAIVGSGRIVNRGVVTASSISEQARVEGRHYRLSFTGAGTLTPLTVYAPTVAAGLASLPTPTRAGLGFVGWQRDGAAFSDSTDLGAGSDDGQPVAVTLAARWGITTPAELTSALDTCPDETVALAADLTVGSAVNVACDVTLDLAGHDLTVAGVTIDADRTFTIDDSEGDGTLVTTSGVTAGIRTTGAHLVVDGGTIRATGAETSAGIGGGYNESGGTTTINAGTVEATAGYYGAAGIGGGYGGTGGTITIDGGTIEARSSYDGAAIGGGTNAYAGAVTINGGDVTAITSEGVGAGIGGAWLSTGGTVRITGGTVTASAVDGGAGIGSGRNASGATSVAVTGGTVSATGGNHAPALGSGQWSSTASPVEIGNGADVTAIGGSGAPTVLGHPQSGARGAVTIDGLVRAPSGTIDVSHNDLTIGATGRILGTTADPTVGASITGTGTIANGGVIALTDVASTVEITGHHYEVVAPTGTVTVYAPTFEAGLRALPEDPTRGIDAFNGWSHDGEPFTATTGLPGASTDGTAVRVELTPTWDEGVAAFDIGDSVTLVPNADPTAVSLTLTDGSGDPVSVDPAEWDVTVPEGVELEHDGAGWRLSSTAVGTGTVTASVEQGSRTYTATLEVVSQVGAVASMTLTHTGDAEEDGTITVTATGADGAGNDLGDVTADVTITSSVATDVIDGNRVTFPHASPHTLTATHVNGTTATLLVEVAAAPAEPVDESPVDEPTDEPGDEPADAAGDAEQTEEAAAKKEAALAETGGSLTPWWLATALALVLVGGGLLRRAQRR